MKKFWLLILTLVSTTTFAAPKSELWAYWDNSDESNPKVISHQEWQSFLDKYLVQDGQHHLIKYASVSNSDKALLNNYINALAALDPKSFNRAEQYAYWVNLYNAITVDLILDAYPVKSITKLGGLFSFGPWGEEVITVDGKKLTLNDIEHRILRPIWNDARTHYAVNCASLGCPNLQAQAFTSQNTQMLLEQAAKAFVNSDKGVMITSKGMTLSSIYEWFTEDFGGNDAAVIKHLQQYRSDVPSSVKIRYDYDWDLNQTK
ncbi:DUF547 domain-containing protein [Vibrio sp. SCSIO 43136]|uniref:DUF547 domain-containing protein n=1 Tax=Vibrio sp. SCSIO 43136 TaxID=2819101 RepID=UPI0020760454|nr:DUF547 domain-containing protein [Vibrio sp. SCSIO 43136]USD64948.1 DUF547 domain-containing protein [Vibrio sp. SCSIO 43136]